MIGDRLLRVKLRENRRARMRRRNFVGCALPLLDPVRNGSSFLGTTTVILDDVAVAARTNTAADPMCWKTIVSLALPGTKLWPWIVSLSPTPSLSGATDVMTGNFALAFLATVLAVCAVANTATGA